MTGVTSGAPPQFGGLTLIRTTAKATLSHYRPGCSAPITSGRSGAQIERGEHHAAQLSFPTGVRFVDNNGQPFQAISRAPSNSGGLFITAAAFASDAITIGDRLTINAGVRFDHSRAISQDLHALDAAGHETGAIVRGLGTLYTWNVVSPRLGVTAKLTADGRTMLRASYGRFNQGVLDRRAQPVPPRRDPDHDQRLRSGDRRLHALSSRWSIPRSTCCSIPRRARRAPTSTRLASIASSAVDWRWRSPTSARTAATSSAWTDVGGQYREETRTLADGRSVPVFVLDQRPPPARRFLLTNPDGYSLTYNGLVMVVEKRRSNGWQAFGSYTFSRAVRAAGVQRSDRRRMRRSAPWPRRSRRPSRSGAIPTTSPTRTAGCRTIVRTCSG